jgi:hypothetical protein
MARVALLGERYLFEAFKRALAGESRCIAAFRTPAEWSRRYCHGFFFLS